MAALALAFLLGGAVMLVESYAGAGELQSRVKYAMGPAFFPRIILVLLMLLALAAVVEAARGRAAAASVPRLANALAMAGATGAYVWLIGSIGFLLASCAFALVCPLLLGYRKLAVLLPLAAVYATTVWYVFDKVLQIVLPASPWFARF
ncbi:MAG: tripartite tricarboxylate transporter TctB family protein [Burkholderiaceae bacterium]